MNLALLNMPFISSIRPSIQLGTLKSFCESKGHKVDDLYFNVSFAEKIGWDFSEDISYSGDHLLGEWVFAKAAHNLPLDERYLNTVLPDLAHRFTDPVVAKTRLIEVREVIAPAWVDEVFASVDWSRFGAVGFSCTFSQMSASLALASKIKKAVPDVSILFGGSALDGEMGQEVLERNPFVDLLINGEGENALLEFLNKGLSTKIFRSSKKVDLDENPPPDYSSYFDSLRSLGSAPRCLARIPLESSRGCWWGERQHCKFCGLNGQDMGFRSKSPDRFLQEVEAVSIQTGAFSFEVVDNIIDHRYFNSLLPELKSAGTSFEFFYEIKANVDEPIVELMKEAGIFEIQPGIESLDSEVLDLMKKGTTATQNILLMRFAMKHGIRVNWNLLTKFPGETRESYEKMVDLLPALFHLDPPNFSGPVRLDRFSPYFNEYRANRDNPSWQLFKNVRPSDLYQFCFPKEWNYWRLAYFYMSEATTQVPEAIYSALEEQVTRWQKSWSNINAQKPSLRFEKGFSHGRIVDSRQDPQARAHRLTGTHFFIARHLDQVGASTNAKIASALELEEEVVESILNDFAFLRFVVKPDKRWVWLPI